MSHPARTGFGTRRFASLSPRSQSASDPIAEANADGVIVTDDNPRGEDGDAIVAGILAGIGAPERALVQRDRARAIENAISQAQPNDAVLVAGKGHEDYQIVGGTTRQVEIVGVIKDVKSAGVNAPTPDEAYFPLQQLGRSGISEWD